MKTIYAVVCVCACLLTSVTSNAQQPKSWTENDRRWLSDSLKITRDQLVEETENLTEAQWNFKESPDRWSIKEVVEHICYWELLLTHEVSKALSQEPQPELRKKAKPDSIYLGFILEQQQHISTEYTKPFTYTLPMGLNDGKNNVAWFLKMRNESVNFIDSTTIDLRAFFMYDKRPNIHQVYITIFGHTERHLRQIRKIKLNANYPGN
ncbi:hypothetical protein BH10BAC2_BH10BAC2_21780 [soil metagenome]